MIHVRRGLMVRFGGCFEWEGIVLVLEARYNTEMERRTAICMVMRMVGEMSDSEAEPGEFKVSIES